MPTKILIVLVATLALTGCNTFRGLGRDVSATGGAISDTAQDTQQAM